MHINRRHKKVKCLECEKQFINNHFKDVHRLPKFNCRVKGCLVYAHNDLEKHKHMKYDHWSKMVFQCNKCPKVFLKSDELHRYLEVEYSRISLFAFSCIRCNCGFLNINMFISHYKDHKENIYGCNGISPPM